MTLETMPDFALSTSHGNEVASMFLETNMQTVFQNTGVRIYEATVRSNLINYDNNQYIG